MEEENIVTFAHFDFGITFYPEAPTEVKQITRERKNISTYSETPKCIPNNLQHNCSFDDEHNSNIFLNPYMLWDTEPTALMTLNYTTDRDSMSNQYLQTTTPQPRTDL